MSSYSLRTNWKFDDLSYPPNYKYCMKRPCQTIYFLIYFEELPSCRCPRLIKYRKAELSRNARHQRAKVPAAAEVLE